MPTIFRVDPTDDLQATIGEASTADKIIVRGTHTGLITVDKSIDIVNGGDAIVEQLKYVEGANGGLLEGVRITKGDTPLPSGLVNGLEIEGGRNIGFIDLEIDGHAFTHGIDMDRRFAHVINNLVFEGIHIHDIEAQGVHIAGSGHYLNGFRVNDILRTSTLHNNDVDAVRVTGTDHTITGWRVDMLPAADHETGGAGQTAPHPDFVQGFMTYEADNVTPLETRRIRIHDNHVTGECGQMLILSNNSETERYISDIDFYDNTGVAADNQPVVLQGIANAKVRRNRFLAKVQHFQMVHIQDAAGGPVDSPNAEITGNDYYTIDGTTSIPFVGITNPGTATGLIERDNVRYPVNGDAELTSTVMTYGDRRHGLRQTV